MDAPQINTIAFDCHDPRLLAQFWTALLGVDILHDYDDFIWLTPQREGGYKLAFQQVPDPTPARTSCISTGITRTCRS